MGKDYTNIAKSIEGLLNNEKIITGSLNYKKSHNMNFQQKGSNDCEVYVYLFGLLVAGKLSYEDLPSSLCFVKCLNHLI